MEKLDILLKKFLWKVGDCVDAKGSFPFGNCIIKYFLDESGGEIEVYNPIKGIYLDNIAEWLLSNIGDRCRQESSEWDEHGFASEADYLRWRHG